MGSGLVAVAAAEGPELGAALDFEGRGPGQPGRPELGSRVSSVSSAVVMHDPVRGDREPG
jgi:hypothetical protein